MPKRTKTKAKRGKQSTSFTLSDPAVAARMREAAEACGLPRMHLVQIARFAIEQWCAEALQAADVNK